MVYFSRATLRFDGACQPNPGEGGGGYVIFNDKNGNDIITGRTYIGWEYEGWNCTNNIAEYLGLIAALDRLSSSNHQIGHLTIEGDSEIVIRQMKGEYNVRSDQLRPLWNVMIIVGTRVYLVHIAFNTYTDKIMKMLMSWQGRLSGMEMGRGITIEN